jgi:hypothetical protein
MGLSGALEVATVLERVSDPGQHQMVAEVARDVILREQEGRVPEGAYPEKRRFTGFCER